MGLPAAVGFEGAVVDVIPVVCAAGTLDTGAVLGAGTVADAVAEGAVVAALAVAVALVVWAAELELALANGTFGVDGPLVNGFAMAPTTPRLRIPPTRTPILTLVLSNLHLPKTPWSAGPVGLRDGLGDSGPSLRGRWDMQLPSDATPLEE